MAEPKQVPDDTHQPKQPRHRKARRWWLDIEVPQRDFSYYDQLLFSGSTDEHKRNLDKRK